MKRLYFTLFIAIAAASVQAQETKKLSLKDCMEYAIMHNYSVKNSKIDVLIQKAQNNQALSASYPHVNGKADFNNFVVPQSQFVDASTFATPGGPEIPKGTIIPISFTIPYAASANITASQLLFDGGVLVALQARKSVLELANQNVTVTEETVRYNVYKAYNSLVIAYRQYDIIKRSLSYARALERDLLITRENGYAEKIEVDRTSVQVNNLATDSIRIGSILTTTEQVLKYQMGMDINTPIVLTDTAVEDRTKVALALLNEPEQYDRVPLYNVLNTSLTLNQYNLKRYQYSAIPTLSAFWAYGTNYGSTRFNDMFLFNRYAANSTVGVSLNVPIFNGFLRANQVSEAKLNIEKSRNNIENMKLTIDFQSAMSRTNLKNAVLQVQSQKRNMELSNSVLDLAQKKYKAGVGSNFEVTQAQTELLRSQNNYFNALLDQINAEADLKKALGLMNTPGTN